MSAALLNLLSAHEHLPTHLAEIVASFEDSLTPITSGPSVAADMLRYFALPCYFTGVEGLSSMAWFLFVREIARMDTTQNNDSAGIRYTAAFLVDFSKLSPALVLANISTLLPHLDGGAYSMRSAMVQTMGHLVSYIQKAKLAAASAEGDDEATKGGVDAMDTIEEADEEEEGESAEGDEEMKAGEDGDEADDDADDDDGDEDILMAEDDDDEDYDEGSSKKKSRSKKNKKQKGSGDSTKAHHRVDSKMTGDKTRNALLDVLMVSGRLEDPHGVTTLSGP